MLFITKKLRYPVVTLTRKPKETNDNYKKDVELYQKQSKGFKINF